MSLLVIETLLFFTSVSAINSASSSEGKAPVGISAEQVGPECLADRLPATFLKEFAAMPELNLQFRTEGVEGIANFRTLSVFSLNININGCLDKKASRYPQGHVPTVDLISADLLRIDCYRPILIDLKGRCALQTREPANVHVLMRDQGNEGIIEFLARHSANDHQLILHRHTGTESYRTPDNLYEKVFVEGGHLVLTETREETVIQYNPPLDHIYTVEKCTKYGLQESQLEKKGFVSSLTVLKRPGFGDLVLLHPINRSSGVHMLLEKTRNITS